MSAELSPQIGSGVLIETMGVHRDPRGCLFEPLNETELARQKNVHVVLTEPGGIRGNHRHDRATEITTLVGPCQIRLKERGVVRDLDVPAGEVWRLTIPPGVIHAFRNNGSTPMLLVSFSTEPHAVGTDRTLREQIL